MTASSRGVVTAVAATALAVGTYTGASFALPALVPASVLAVGVVLFGAGWPRLLGVPAQRGSATVIIGSGLVALVTATVTQMFSYLAVVTAIGIVAAFVHQMLRKDGRPRLVESISATVAGVIVSVFSAGWITVITRYTQPDAGYHPSPTPMILVAACSLTAACIGTAFTPSSVSATASTVLAGVTGALLGGLLFPAVGLFAGAAIGASLGVLQSALHILFGMFPASRRFRPALSAALLPVLAAGVPVYTIARVIANLGDDYT